MYPPGGKDGEKGYPRGSFAAPVRSDDAAPPPFGLGQPEDRSANFSEKHRQQPEASGFHRSIAMATGNARYVRYILFAFFVRIARSLGSWSQCARMAICLLGWDRSLTGGLRGSLQGLVVIYFISHSNYQGVAIPNDGSTTFRPPTDTPKQPATKPDGGSTKGSGSAPTLPKNDGVVMKPGEKYNPAEWPMPMSPADPGWNDLTSIPAGPRMNATFVTLARNSDVWDIARSIRQVEDRFNRRYNYDWVFLNDKPFDATFKKVTTSLVSGKTHYGEIPKEHWSFPEWIDQDKARKVREDMAQRKIIYGDSVSYRHMCRFESGFFFRQPLMLNYEWYWRVEPSVELFCDVHYDPFRFMAENNKKYSFTLSLYEYVETIPTLWDSVKKFMKNHPEHIAEDNAMGFLSDDGGDSYNHCHFVSSDLEPGLRARVRRTWLLTTG